MTCRPAALGAVLMWLGAAMVGDAVYPDAGLEFVLGVLIIAVLLSATCGAILGRECWRP